jgi:hypothetical protein
VWIGEGCVCGDYTFADMEGPEMVEESLAVANYSQGYTDPQRREDRG